LKYTEIIVLLAFKLIYQIKRLKKIKIQDESKSSFIYPSHLISIQLINSSWTSSTTAMNAFNHPTL